MTVTVLMIYNATANPIAIRQAVTIANSIVESSIFITPEPISAKTIKANKGTAT